MPPADRVPTAPLREAYLRLKSKGEVNAEVMAIRMDWWRSPKHKGGTHDADSTRVLKRLGINEQTCTKILNDGTVRRYRQRSETVGYDLAVRLIRAMDLDPVDFDL